MSERVEQLGGAELRDQEQQRAHARASAGAGDAAAGSDHPDLLEVDGEGEDGVEADALADQGGDGDDGRGVGPGRDAESGEHQRRRAHDLCRQVAVDPEPDAATASRFASSAAVPDRG